MPVNAMQNTIQDPSAVEFDGALLRRLNLSGPRYTSYPSAVRFGADYGYRDYLQAVAGLRTRGSVKPLSLYLHIPFCDSVCRHCVGDLVVARQRGKAGTYLGYLKREIEMQGRLFAGMNQVSQLHLGGGTPTYLSDAQLGDLMLHVRRCFQLAPDQRGAYAIEVGPRAISSERIHSLRAQGFNRISLGVQDDDSQVPQPLDGVQPEQDCGAIVAAARAAGFRSVGIDVIYGLPLQDAARMAATLDKAIAAAPDHVVLRVCASAPQPFKARRRSAAAADGAGDAAAAVPAADMRLALLALCIARLSGAGYVYIGMDHFARPGDELAVAQRQGRLHCNFQGYSTHAGADLVACGVSAIGAVGASYSQNAKTLDAYYDLLDRDELPIVRGIRLDMDDLLRRHLIQTLMCHFELSVPAIEQAFPIVFANYFATELAGLRALEHDGLLAVGPDFISVTPRGRFLIRTICMVFDRYLASPAQRPPEPATL